MMERDKNEERWQEIVFGFQFKFKFQIYYKRLRIYNYSEERRRLYLRMVYITYFVNVCHRLFCFYIIFRNLNNEQT